MKKILNILLLAFVICCIGMNAKTTKKSGRKTSTTSSVVSNNVDKSLKKIPSFNKLINTQNQKTLFQNLGYKVTSKTVKNELYDYFDDQDYYITLITATQQFEDGGEVIFEEDNCGSYKITIKGMPKVLEKYYQNTKSEVKQFNRKYGDHIFYITTEKQGNRITVKVPCD